MLLNQKPLKVNGRLGCIEQFYSSTVEKDSKPIINRVSSMRFFSPVGVTKFVIASISLFSFSIEGVVFELKNPNYILYINPI
jgi:hypothetical protein